MADEQTAAASNQQEIDAEASARAEMVEAAIAVRAALDAEARAALDAAVAEAVAAERERCGRIAEDMGTWLTKGLHMPTEGNGADAAAAAIRGGDDG